MRGYTLPIVSELVTGEGVVLELRIARPATRVLALAIDLAVQVTAFILVLIPLSGALEAGSEPLARGVGILLSVLIFVGYNTTIETLTRGKSVGKYALGLRVVADDGGPVAFRQALTRALAGVFADFFLTIGIGAFVVSMLNARGKRIGDLLAGTLVVRERAPRSVDPLPAVPDQLRGWAASLEFSGLPDDLAASARSYLARWHSLSPAAREELGERLATAVRAYVSPPPPPDVPAWAYLTAVLTERRDRALGNRGTDRPRPDSGVSGQDE